MSAVIWDWVGLILRWAHVMLGIAWIGTSFHFIWLDASLRKSAAAPNGVAGESWMVHGGGFYHAQKYLVAPETLPKELHWFKYEAYFTWISGFLLLAIVYYLNADAFLVDPGVLDLSPAVAIAISVGSLVAGWLIYDEICRSPLGRDTVPLALLVLWQIASQSGWLSHRILPAPSAVARSAVELAASGELLRHVRTSTARALTGFAVGGGLGLALGLLTGLSRWAETLLDSTIQMVRNIPSLALIPLVILWFGIDETAKLFLVALGVFFPIYINTLHGVRTVDPQLIEMGRIYGMSERELFRRVIFPGALPSIFVGLRFALGIMWLTLIVAETIAASSGLGYMAMQAREFMQIDVVVLSILIYALLGKLADTASRVLERLTLAWHPAFRKS